MRFLTVLCCIIVCLLSHMLSSGFSYPVKKESYKHRIGKENEGSWQKRVHWKARWVKEWHVKKIWFPTWKKVWGPVEINEWIPLPTKSLL